MGIKLSFFSHLSCWLSMATLHQSGHELYHTLQFFFLYPSNFIFITLRLQSCNFIMLLKSGKFETLFCSLYDFILVNVWQFSSFDLNNFNKVNLILYHNLMLKISWLYCHDFMTSLLEFYDFTVFSWLNLILVRVWLLSSHNFILKMLRLLLWYHSHYI